MDPLSEIAQKYNTDKFGHHNFTPIYNDWFRLMNEEPIIFLELGIGGYHYPDRGGGSLRMWREYFPNAIIAGTDLYDKSELKIDGVKMFKGNQIDRVFLEQVLMEIGEPDVVIDDASHINAYCIETFDILFPRLKSGGLYFVEDVHTSYWAENYGGEPDIYKHESQTTINHFLHMVHSLHKEYVTANIPKRDDIKGIHFYHELLVIEKV